MTVGALINAMFEATGLQPKAVAVDWLQRWSTTSSETTLALDTVTSRVSNLRNDRPDGLRFFFGDVGRGNLLLDLLGATDQQREDVRARAEVALREGGLQTRVVIDVTPFPVGPALGVALRELLADDLPLQPVRLLVTEAQADAVPFSLARRPEFCVIEVVKDAVDACDRVAELGQRAVLVVSRDPFEPIDRWAAADFQPRASRLVLEPQDAFVQFARSGRIEGPTGVLYPLDEVCSEVVQQSFPDPSPGGIRRLIVDLASGGPAGVDPRVRRWWARELEVPASSTADERVRRALSQVRLEPNLCSEQRDLDTALAMARRRPLQDKVLVLNGVFHILNAEFSAPPGTEHIVRHHAVPCTTPSIRRLRNALGAYSVDDWRDDPLLAQLLAKLGGQDGADVELRHARAWFLRYGKRAPAPAPSPTEAVAPLAKLLATPAPRAELIVTGRDLILGPDLDRLHHDTLAHLDSKGEMLVRRTDRPAALTGASHPVLDPHHADRWRDPRQVEDNDDNCLNSFEAGIGGWDVPPTLAPQLQGLKIEPAAWDEADVWVAVAWRALRRAVQRGDTEPLGEGRVFVDLGNGLAAVVEVRTWTRAAEARAALRASGRHYNDQLAIEVLPVITHVTGSDRGGPLAPSMIWIAGSGIAADVRFAPATLLASRPLDMFEPRPKDHRVDDD